MTNRKHCIFKIIFWVSISLITIRILTIIIGQFITVEIVDSNLRNIHDFFRGIGFPIAIIFTLTGTIKKTDDTISKVVKSILTFIFVAIVFFFIIASSLTEMCSCTTDNVVFENKQNNSIKIVKREFGCGATDSGSPTFKLFEIHEYANCVIWVKDVDTNKIDKNKWKRIENKE